MYYVYVYKVKKMVDTTLVVLKNAEYRLSYHNFGRQRSTRHRIPFKLVYTEVFEKKIEALKRNVKSNPTKEAGLSKKISGSSRQKRWSEWFSLFC